jgi:hypothetical protein
MSWIPHKVLSGTRGARADRGLGHAELCRAVRLQLLNKTQLKNHAYLEHGPCWPAETFFDRPE